MAAASLDPDIFTPSLYRAVLDLWFGHLPEDGSLPDAQARRRWYSLFDTAEERSDFDRTCHQVASRALEALGPHKHPLPPFTSFAEDKKQAAALSASMRQSIARVSGDGGGGGGGQEQSLPLPLAALGMTLLLDQFSRNTMRDAAGQAVIYTHYDRLTRALLHYIVDEANRADALYGIDRHPALKHDQPRRQFFYLPLQHSEDLADHDLIHQRNEDVHAEGSPTEIEYMTEQEQFEVRHRTLLERFGRYPHRNKVLGRTPTTEELTFLAEGGDTFGTQ